eukprot:Nk52_evm9s272 gene=Nk52_evmTU9s272
MYGGAEAEVFPLDRHRRFFLRCLLHGLPGDYASGGDSSRMTLCFFALSGLDLLNSVVGIGEEEHEDGSNQQQKPLLKREQGEELIEWIYAQQVDIGEIAKAVAKKGDEENGDEEGNRLLDRFRNDPDYVYSRAGFRGGPWLGIRESEEEDTHRGFLWRYDGGHLAMTYTALCCLLILGDDLSRVRKTDIIKGLRYLQLEDGSFWATATGGENDMRFLYCACCICTILDDWSSMDRSSALEYIYRSQNFDWAFGQGPQLESHGGSTFCAVASLYLMGGLPLVSSSPHNCPTPLAPPCTGQNKESEFDIGRAGCWMRSRQSIGFNGRPNKIEDTCYAFWVGASMVLLGIHDWSSPEHTLEFLKTTQHPVYGGFAKWPDHLPDILHSYFGVCGLSLNGYTGVASLHSALNISTRAYRYMEYLHRQAIQGSASN